MLVQTELNGVVCKIHSVPADVLAPPGLTAHVFYHEQIVSICPLMH